MCCVHVLLLACVVSCVVCMCCVVLLAFVVVCCVHVHVLCCVHVLCACVVCVVLLACVVCMYYAKVLLREYMKTKFWKLLLWPDGKPCPPATSFHTNPLNISEI